MHARVCVCDTPCVSTYCIFLAGISLSRGTIRWLVQVCMTLFIWSHYIAIHTEYVGNIPAEKREQVLKDINREATRLVQVCAHEVHSGRLRLVLKTDLRCIVCPIAAYSLSVTNFQVAVFTDLEHEAYDLYIEYSS